MGLFNKLDLALTSTIDWEMTPEYTFGTFESWGGTERVRSKTERIYYFFIDSWGDTPKLCLMERGIKHARVVAEILAPEDLVMNCASSQGKVALFERSFAIDEVLKQWLIENVVETDDDSKVIPLVMEQEEGLGLSGLPGKDDKAPDVKSVDLPEEFTVLSEEDVVGRIKKHNFYDFERNEQGEFKSYLVDNGDGMTVTDKVTGLMWQREGHDIMSLRMMRSEIEKTNKENFAGYSNWRLPTLDEAMSLMESSVNEKDQHTHPCFSAQQPFIFVAASRKPGGYWYVDYKHGRAFWASGTIPGGFGRFCRRENGK